MQSKVAIPRELMVAKTARELFSFLARQIEAFLRTHHGDHFEAHVRRRKTMSAKEGYRDESIFRLGFTFSFPVHQLGINKGTLIRWTKGFDIQDAVGKDVCALLQSEIDVLHLPVRVAALVNDTVGTLMARSYTSPAKAGALLGGIFGTGTNGAYVERLDKIIKLARVDDAGSDYDRSTGEMVVNVEWGSFDNPLRVLPNTPYDEALDRESVNPGIQMFEKRVSGMFLGEILRRAMLRLVQDPEALLFNDQDSSSNDVRSTTTIAEDSNLYKQWGIDTSFLSIVQEDHSVGLKLVRQTLDQYLGVSAASIDDAEAVKELVMAVGKRSARLSAVAIGSVVIKSGRLSRTVADPVATTSGGAVKLRPPPPSSGGVVDAAKQGNLTGAMSGVVEKVRASPTPMIDQAPSVLPSSVDTNNDDDGEGDDEPIDIGVDGSLVEFYPGFIEYVREALREIPQIGPVGEKQIRIEIAKDGSGVGAALIALVAGRAGPPPMTENENHHGGFEYLVKTNSNQLRPPSEIQQRSSLQKQPDQQSDQALEQQQQDQTLQKQQQQDQGR